MTIWMELIITLSDLSQAQKHMVLQDLTHVESKKLILQKGE